MPGAEPENRTYPLHDAVLAGDFVLATKMLKTTGMMADVKNGNRQTTLHCAAMQGKCEAIEFIVRHGANMESKDSSGYTPIQLAAAHGHAACS